MRLPIRWGLLLAMMLAAGATAQVGPAAPPQPLKLSTAQGPAYPLGKAGEVWATLIAKRSGGRLAVEHFPGATLASRDPAREFGALRYKNFELAVGSSLVWSAQVPQLNVLALPWLFPNAPALESVLEGSTGKRLSAILEASGIVVVAWAANGFIELASRKAVHGPADLAGVKIRIQVSQLLEETLAALNASPSAMSVSNARTALENGELDGQESSVASYAASSLAAGPLRHLLLWQAHADALIFAVNRSVWDSWNEADRQLVRDAALEASRQSSAFAKALSDDRALAMLGMQGALVTRLTPAGRDAFREAVRAVYDRWTPIIGNELVDSTQAEIAAERVRR